MYVFLCKVTKKKETFHLHAVLLPFFLIKTGSQVKFCQGNYVIRHTCLAEKRAVLNGKYEVRELHLMVQMRLISITLHNNKEVNDKDCVHEKY